MVVDDLRAATIQVILVSGERGYAEDLMAGLVLSRAAFFVEQLAVRDLFLADLERCIGAPSEQTPMLVILDFDSLQTSCESLVARILGFRGTRAIECLVTRSPADPAISARLQSLGAFLFDERESVAEFARALR